MTSGKKRDAAAPMRILLRRLDGAHHRLTLERADGTRLERDLETRSTLLHDLVHYAVEAEAGIADGFWGSVAAGVDPEALTMDDSTPSGAALAESLVGPMQSVWKGDFGPDEYVALLSSRAPFVDAAFVERVRERIRRLWGRWRGTGFHETMELVWPPEVP